MKKPNDPTKNENPQSRQLSDSEIIDNVSSNTYFTVVEFGAIAYSIGEVRNPMKDFEFIDLLSNLNIQNLEAAKEIIAELIVIWIGSYDAVSRICEIGKSLSSSDTETNEESPNNND